METLDFDAVRINVICLEADGHAPAKDEAVAALSAIILKPVKGTIRVHDRLLYVQHEHK